MAVVRCGAGSVSGFVASCREAAPAQSVVSERTATKAAPAGRLASRAGGTAGQRRTARRAGVPRNSDAPGPARRSAKPCRTVPAENRLEEQHVRAGSSF
eukprot:gene6606-biopygen4408